MPTWRGTTSDQRRLALDTGNGKRGPDESADYEVAVMDDFIYGEPQAAN
jgi:hypothetical protein